MDAIIHNAGIYLEPGRGETADGHAKTPAVNVLAPYLLTGLIDRPALPEAKFPYGQSDVARNPVRAEASIARTISAGSTTTSPVN